MSRLEHRTNEGWGAYDYRALSILLGLLALLWGLWYIGHGPRSCGPAEAALSSSAANGNGLAAGASRNPATLELQSQKGQMRLLGRVESEDVKSTIGKSAVSVFGAGNVSNGLTVDPSVARPKWQAKVTDLITEMKSWGPVSNVRIDGNATTLAGAVSAQGEKVQRGNRVAELLGPEAVIDNRLFVVEPPPAPPPPLPPKVPASVDVRTVSNGVQLSGRVESDDTKSAVEAAAKSVFGAENVSSSLQVESNVLPPPLAQRMTDIFKVLQDHGTSKGLVITGPHVTLAGVAASADEKLAPEKALNKALGSDALVDNRIAVFEPAPPPPPAPAPEPVKASPELVIVKSPASIALHNSDGRVKLLGSVPSDAARDAFGAAAQSVYGTGAVTNALTVDTATEEATWQSKAADVLAALKSWGGASMVRADGNAVTLTGTAPSVEERDARGATIAKLFGGGAPVDNRIDVIAPVAMALPPVDPATQTITCDMITRGVKIGFESGRSALDATGRRALDDIVACLTGKVYEIIGHTDSVGTPEFNAVLSKRRAEAVATYLKGRGVQAELRTSGAGSSQPVASNAIEAGKAQNRRIEFKPL